MDQVKCKDWCHSSRVHIIRPEVALNWSSAAIWFRTRSISKPYSKVCSAHLSQLWKVLLRLNLTFFRAAMTTWAACQMFLWKACLDQKKKTKVLIYLRRYTDYYLWINLLWNCMIIYFSAFFSTKGHDRFFITIAWPHFYVRQ